MVTVDKLVIKIGADVKSALTGIAAVESSMSRMETQVGKASANIRKSTASVVKSLTKLGAVAAVVGAAIGGVAAKQSADMESYMATLEQLTGSQELAAQQMQRLLDFAKQTPFELPGLIEATVKLKAYGIEADAVLGTLGDTASAMGKPINLAVEALADAQTGEFERLKEFGIKAVQISKSNAAQLGATTEQIGLTALTSTAKNGNARVDVIDRNNREIITSTLQSIWNEKYAGGMLKQSQTLKGMVSNIKDSMFQASLAVMGFDAATGAFADESIFAKIKDQVGALLGVINELDIDAIAGKIKAAFDALMQTLTELMPTFTNFKSIIVSVAGIVGDLFNAINGGSGETKTFTDAINTLTGALASVFAWIDEHPTITKLAATIGIAAVAFAHIVPVVAAVGSAIGTVAGVVASATAFFAAGGTIVSAVGVIVAALGGPITLIIGAIALLGAAWATNMFGIRDKTAAAFDWIKGAFVGLMNILGNAMTAYINFYTKSFNKLIPLLQKIFPEMEKVAEVSFNNIEKTTLDKTEKVKDSIKSVAETTAETATEIDNSAEKIKQTFDDVASAALSFDEAVEASKQRGLADVSPEQAEKRFGILSPNALSAIGGAATGAQITGQVDAGIATVGAGIAQASTLASAGTGRDMEEVENILRESKVTHDASLETQREAGTKLEAVNIGIGAGVEATRAIATAVATLATEIKSIPRGGGGGGFGDGGNTSGSI